MLRVHCETLRYSGVTTVLYFLPHKERNKPEEQECSDSKEVEDQKNNTSLISSLMHGS